MKKLVVVRYLAYITFILIILSILSGEAFAAKSSPETGDGNQYADENTIDTENYINSSEETNSTESSSSESVKEKDRNQIRDRDKYTARTIFFSLQRVNPHSIHAWSDRLERWQAGGSRGEGGQEGRG